LPDKTLIECEDEEETGECEIKNIFQINEIIEEEEEKTQPNEDYIEEYFEKIEKISERRKKIETIE